MRELIARCWEALRERNFVPYGQGVWGEWFLRATDDQLRICATELKIPGHEAPAPKAIKTEFMGHRFRSRLEARWAVYFSTQGIVYEYEREGFVLASGPYLPDFWLPHVSMWAEVKPIQFDPIELRKCRELCDATSHPVLLLDGLPAVRAYNAFERFEIDTPDLVPYLLTSAHLDQRRFHAIETETTEADIDRHWPDVRVAVHAARRAQFEAWG